MSDSTVRPSIPVISIPLSIMVYSVSFTQKDIVNPYTVFLFCLSCLLYIDRSSLEKIKLISTKTSAWICYMIMTTFLIQSFLNIGVLTNGNVFYFHIGFLIFYSFFFWAQIWMIGMEDYFKKTI